MTITFAKVPICVGGKILSMDTKRCYEVLGLPLDASQDQVKEAYHQLAREWHPDKVAHNSKLQAIAQEEMKNINAAYDVLKFDQSIPRSASSTKKAQPEQNRAHEDEENRQRTTAEQRKREAEQKERETEQKQQETKRRQREAERLRVQQEAEAAYQSEQLANAKKEAERKQQEAKRIKSRETPQPVSATTPGKHFVNNEECVECGASKELWRMVNNYTGGSYCAKCGHTWKLR